MAYKRLPLPSQRAQLPRTRAKPKRKSPRARAAEPLLKATVLQLAGDNDNNRNINPNKQGTTTKAQTGMMERIKKCLTRARHPRTPEHEAKSALHMASKLMRQFNITQTELFSDEATEETHAREHGGQSIVEIRHTDGSYKSVNRQGFVGTLMQAMQLFFACKSYWKRRASSVEVVFYGISENTVAAAIAFEMIYNLIVEWAKSKGRNEKNSYYLGIAAGLWERAKAERAEMSKDTSKQLILFENAAGRIADEFLKFANIRLSRHSRSFTGPRDLTAYYKGKQDSSKVDPRRRRLK